MKRLGLIVVSILISSLVIAQNDEYRSTITGSVGLTLSGAIVKAVEASSLGTVEASGIPNIEIAYDYGVAKWFSVGAMFTYQTNSLEESVEVDVFGQTLDEPFSSSFELSRIYIGTSLLFHYANSGRMDLYSGFRIGYKSWNYTASYSAPGVEEQSVDLEDVSFFNDGIGFQVVLFGLRGYVTENIGIHAEILSIGAPHIAAIGLNYRF